MPKLTDDGYREGGDLFDLDDNGHELKSDVLVSTEGIVDTSPVTPVPDASDAVIPLSENALRVLEREDYPRELLARAQDWLERG